MGKIFFPVVLVFFVCNTIFAQSDTLTSKGDASKVYQQKEILVTAHQLKEEQPVGSYKQPEWTLHRRSPLMRIYIQTQPGEVEFEQWVELRVQPKSPGGHSVARISEELEFGLASRTQLDIYLHTLRQWNSAGSTFGLRGWSAEMRWAFADWGVIPGNPTLYLEYSVFDSVNGDEEYGYDKVEPKLLLGGIIANGWHWGLNLVSEWSLAPQDKRVEEYKATGTISYALSDQNFSLGTAFSFAHEIDRGTGSSDIEILLGPSVQWRPMKKSYVDLEPLFGITEESKQLDMFIVFGWEL